MGDTEITKPHTYIIFAEEVSRVREALRNYRIKGQLKKIILIVPGDRVPPFEKLRPEIAIYYTTDFEVKEVKFSDIALCADSVYDIVTKEKKIGNDVILNITDSSVFAFTISAGLIGSITKSKVITTSFSDTPVDVPLIPYCRIATRRYEILKTLGEKGVDNTHDLKKHLDEKYPVKEKPKIKKIIETSESREMDKKKENTDTGIEKGNLSAQLTILEDRGFIVREKNRTSKTIRCTVLGLIIQKAYEDYPPSLKKTKNTANMSD